MSARHTTALRRALRQCCGGTAERTVMVRAVTADPTGTVDPDLAATVRVCTADLARLMTELRGGELTGYELSPPWAPGGARCGAADPADGGSIAAPDDDRARLVAGLRQLADWYETSGAPVPEYPGFRYCVNTEDDDAGRATVAEVAAALGVDHDATAYRPETSREFAGLTFEAFYVPEEDMAAYGAKQDAIRELIRAGWKPGDPVPTPADADPLRYSREVDAEVTGAPLPPGIEGISVSSPPHNTGRPVPPVDAVSPLELASPAPVAGREGCDGCGKVGHVAPHRPGCPVAAPRAPHEAGDHSSCAHGGALCEPTDECPDPWHVGLRAGDIEAEQDCPCEQAPCGLVDSALTHPVCAHHPVSQGKTMRQMHRASQCPALGGPR